MSESEAQVALEECRSELERRSIEYEQNLHSHELQIKALQTQLDQVKVLTVSLEEAKSGRAGLETEVSRLKVVEKLKLELDGRIGELEKDKRGLLTVVNKREVEVEGLLKDLEESRKEKDQLKKTFRAIESEAQKAKNDMALKDFEIERVRVESERLKKDRDFYEGELERGRAAWTTERTEKQSQISSLQSSLDSTRAQLTSASSQLTIARESNDTLQSRLNEALIDLKATKSKLAESESNFRIEIESQSRLVALLEERDKETSQRVAEVEEDWEKKQEEIKALEDQWTEHLEAERRRGDQLEVRIEELEKEKQELIAGLLGVEDDRLDRESGLSTPRLARYSSGPVMSASAKAIQGKKGKSYTEIYSDYIRSQEELSAQRAEVKRLELALKEVIDSVEEQAPTLREQRINYDRIVKENSDLTSQLSIAIDDRDEYEQIARSHKLDLDSKTRELDIVQQQLSDVSSQLKNLLITMGKNVDPLIDERSQQPSSMRGNFDVRLEGNQIITTGDVITQNLLTFNSIAELQEQNMKLLRVAREISSRMELTEQEVRERYEDQERAAVEEAHTMIVRLKDEIDSLKLRNEALKREREMFQRMAQSSTRSVPQPHPQPLTPDDLIGNGIEVQREFSVYKSEMTLHLDKYREDLEASQKARREAEVNLAKMTAENEYLDGRINNLELDKKGHVTEIAALQRTMYQLQDQNSRIENHNNELRNELADVKGRADKYKYERDSLKSEKDVWKQTETRLVTENETLNKERMNLHNLINTVQALQNDADRLHNDDRRRFEGQVSKLEAQLQEARESVNREIEVNKQLTFRRDSELKESSEKIEKLSAEAHLARENYIQTKGNLDHVQQRLQDLERDLVAKDEKLSVYERGTTATTEQMTELLIADLRSQVASLTKDLEQRRDHVEELSAISRQAEAELQTRIDMYDELKSQFDRDLANKENELISATDRLRIVGEELTRLEGDNSNLKRDLEGLRDGTQKDRMIMDQALSDLKSSEDRFTLARTRAMEEATRLEAQVREWREKYEKEVIDRGTSLSRVQEIQISLDEHVAKVKQLEISEQNAREKLTTAEESWREIQEKLKEEATAERQKTEDLNKQNALLWQQIEGLNQRMNDVVSQRTSDGIATDSSSLVVNGDEDNVGRLNELIRYLRREKDVLVVTAQSKDAEISRLRSDIRDLQRQVDQLRQQLVEERQRSNDLQQQTSRQADLDAKNAQVQLYKDSNDTLRRQHTELRTKVSRLEDQVQKVSEELLSTKREKLNLEATRDVQITQIKSLNEENQGLRDRQKQFLEKYDRIDPAEFQSAKENVERLTEELLSLKQKIVEYEAASADSENYKQKFEDAQDEANRQSEQVVQGRERFRALQAQARDLRSKVQSTEAERDTLKTEIEQLHSELTLKQAAHTSAVEELKGVYQTQETNLKTEIDNLTKEKTSLESQLACTKVDGTDVAPTTEEPSAEVETLKQQIQNITSQKATLQSELQASKAESERLQSSLSLKEAELLELRREIDEKSEQIKKLEQSTSGTDDTASEDNSKLAAILQEAEERHREDKAKAIQEAIQSVHQELTATMTKATTPSSSEEEAKLRSEVDKLRKELATLRQRLLDKEKELEASRKEMAEAIAKEKSAASAIQEKAVHDVKQELSLKFTLKEASLKKANEKVKELTEKLRTSEAAHTQKVKELTDQLNAAGNKVEPISVKASSTTTTPQGLSIAGISKAVNALNASPSETTGSRGRGIARGGRGGTRGAGVNHLLAAGGALGRGVGLKRTREGEAADTTNKKPKPQ